jgi:uncharacterized protein (TIGR02145 family)
MKNSVLKVAGIALIAILPSEPVTGQGKNGTAKDVDGNVYKTVTIGTQTWMAENLKTTRYRDETPIPLVTDHKKWRVLTNGAYCHYDNDPGKAAIYGRLYNFHAVVDSRNICPGGWHVPTDAEWQTLIDYLGGEQTAGGQLKETGNIHWSKNAGATNKSGFTALPGGRRDILFVGDHTFEAITLRGYFWSSTESDNRGASWFRALDDIGRVVERLPWRNEDGMSVRCVKN